MEKIEILNTEKQALISEISELEQEIALIEKKIKPQMNNNDYKALLLEKNAVEKDLEESKNELSIIESLISKEESK